MEKEQIVKALECLHKRILNTDLAEKVTESEMMAIINALSLIRELTEENTRLREKADRNLENLKAVLEERSENTIVADTVQDIRVRLAMHFGTYTDKTEVKVSDVFKVIDRIAEELLDGETENRGRPPLSDEMKQRIDTLKERYGILERMVKKMLEGHPDTCVSCGRVIPEGRQVCPNCEGEENDNETSN